MQEETYPQSDVHHKQRISPGMEQIVTTIRLADVTAAMDFHQITTTPFFFIFSLCDPNRIVVLGNILSKILHSSEGAHGGISSYRYLSRGLERAVGHQITRQTFQ